MLGKIGILVVELKDFFLHFLSILSGEGAEVIMTNQKPEIKQIEKRLVGESLGIGEYTLQPVAQLTGRYLTARGETGEGAGALLHLTPLEVLVGAGEAEPYALPLTNESQEAMKGIAQAGLMVAVVCWVLIIAAKIFRFTRRS
jgi:hypothetical protein